MSDLLMKDLERRMDSALEVLQKDFSGLRTGRASTNLLDPIVIEAYGSRMPLSQVGTVSAPEARLLTVQVWDKSMVSAVEKAIRESDLGLNPTADGQLVRVRLPELSQERRQELAKVAKKYAETARIAIRNVRRDGIEQLREDEKGGKISEDDLHRQSDDIQKLTDQSIKKVDTLLIAKEKDILTV